MEKVLFCKIASMIWYKGVCPKDTPFNGGKFPRETGTCGEDRNFMPVQTEYGEMCFGFVEPKRGKSGNTNQLRIENIRGANAKTTDDAIDDICVIWCATTDLNETSVIGWYKNATVYREIQELEYEDGEIQIYNVHAKSENCVLLPRNTRHKYIWNAPVARYKGYGFGESMLWYAREPEAEAFVERLLKNIEEYNEENWLYEYPPELERKYISERVNVMPQVKKHAHDLEKLLDEASKIVPTAKFYQRPTIKWSEEYRAVNLGEYIYGKNTIIIDRLLDSEKVSHDALLQLVCHELSHQEYKDEKENDANIAKIMDISALRALRERDEIFQWENFYGTNIFPTGEDILFCFVSSQTFNEIITVSDYGRYNYILADEARGGDIESVDKRVFPLVILITFYEGIYYIAGWLTHAIYYAKIKKSMHGKFGFYNFSYNLQTFNMGCNLFFRSNMISFELNSNPNMDNALRQIKNNGFAVVSHKEDWVLDCVAQMYNYPCELYRPGMNPESIHDISPILSKNISEIVELVYQKAAFSYYRGVCLANKAVSLERNYETMMAQGFALHMAGYLDESLTAYREAMSFDATRVEPYIYALRILCMMNRKEEAMLYASMIHSEWNWEELKIDKNLRNIYDICVKHLRIEPLPNIYWFTPEPEL